jgi:hypothetical protein
MYVFICVCAYLSMYLSIYVSMILFMYVYIYVYQSYIILTVKVKQNPCSYYILCVLYKNLSQFAIENDLVLSWYGTVLSPALIRSALSEAHPTRLRCAIKLCTSTVPWHVIHPHK